MKLPNIISRFQKKKDQGTEELLSISRAVEPKLNQTALEIFSAHWAELVQCPNDYIVPAVWGVGSGGPLTDTQREIHLRVEPMVREVLKAFGSENLTESQRFAITFLVRDLVISKITCMIQMFSIYVGERNLGPEQVAALLKTLKVQGNA